MLKRQALRDQVREQLLEWMLTGRLAEGQRLSLTDAARGLGVSVTPVREALFQLEQAGIVEAVPNKGFSVRSLSLREAEQIYPVIAALESMLVAGSSYTQLDLDRIQLAAQEFEEQSEAAASVRADLAFHEALAAPSMNDLAKRYVRDLKVRVFFYEQALLRKLADDSEAQHGRIVELLRQGDTESAASELRHNWLHSLDALRAALPEDDPNDVAPHSTLTPR